MLWRSFCGLGRSLGLPEAFVAHGVDPGYRAFEHADPGRIRAPGRALDQAGEAAPVIGVKTANAFDYRDLIRVWARGSRMGRDFTTLLADEDVSIDLLLLKEFFGFDGVAKAGKLNLKSNIPSQSDLFIHGVVAANSLLLVDKNAALIKLMVEALSLESERIVQNGINATYLKTRLGFAKMYQDAAVILNNTIAYNPIAGQAGGFPVYMDPKPIETAILKGRAAI